MFKFFNILKDAHQDTFTKRKLQAVMRYINNYTLLENNYLPLSQENSEITLLYLMYCFEDLFSEPTKDLKNPTLLNINEIITSNLDIFNKHIYGPLIDLYPVFEGTYKEEYEEFEVAVEEIIEKTNQSLIHNIKNTAKKDSLLLITNEKKGLMPVTDYEKYLVPAVVKFTTNMSYLNLLNK